MAGTPGVPTNTPQTQIGVACDLIDTDAALPLVRAAETLGELLHRTDAVRRRCGLKVRRRDFAPLALTVASAAAAAYARAGAQEA